MTAGKAKTQYSACRSQKMAYLLSGLRVASSLFISEKALPFASRISTKPLQLAFPLFLRRFRLPFVSAANLRLNASLFLGFLLFLLVTVNLDVFGPLQSRLSRLPTLRGKCLRFLSSFPCLFPLKVKMVNRASIEKRGRNANLQSFLLLLLLLSQFFRVGQLLRFLGIVLPLRMEMLFSLLHHVIAILSSLIGNVLFVWKRRRFISSQRSK